MADKIAASKKKENILTLVFQNLPRLRSIIETDGWKKLNTGTTSQINYNYRFDLYVRERKLAEITQTGDDSEISPMTVSEKTCKYKVSKKVSNHPMGLPTSILTPSNELPVLSHFGNYPSLVAIRKNAPALVISFDSEWVEVSTSTDTRREVLSRQFAVINGANLIEFVFLRKHEKFNLHMELALGRIFDYLKLPSVDVRTVIRYASLQKVSDTDDSDYIVKTITLTFLREKNMPVSVRITQQNPAENLTLMKIGSG